MAAASRCHMLHSANCISRHSCLPIQPVLAIDARLTHTSRWIAAPDSISLSWVGISGRYVSASASKPGQSGRGQGNGANDASTASKKTEAGLDAVMQKFQGLGQPKAKKATVDAVQPAERTSQKTAPKNAPGRGINSSKQQQQQQVKPQATKGKPPAKEQPKQQQQQPSSSRPKPRQIEDEDIDLDSLDVDKLWNEVDRAVKRKSSKSRTDDSDDEDGLHASAKPSAPSGGFKGFGAPPASANAAATSSQQSSSVTSSKGKGSAREPLRIFLYATEEAGALKAIEDAGLLNQVILETDVKKCQAVVTAKLSRNGKHIKLVQGERTAANAGVPFLCVGRNMTGSNLRAALLPLLNPHWEPKQAAPLSRDAARAAMRAFIATGQLPTPAQPASGGVAGGAAASHSGRSAAPGISAPAHVIMPTSKARQAGSNSEEDDELDMLGELEEEDGEDMEEEEEEEEEAEAQAVRLPKARAGTSRMSMGSRGPAKLSLGRRVR